MKISLTPVLVVLVGACAGSVDTADSSTDRDLVFVDVNAVDVAGGRVVPGRTVVIAGNQINSVGLAGDMPIPPGARVIDGSGRFLIPGLVDVPLRGFRGKLTFIGTGV